METVLSLAIPGVPILLVAVGVYELRRQKRRNRPGTPLTATYINEFTAMFYGTKRMELDHRDSMSMMRKEDAEGAPPRVDVDLDRGIAVLRPEDRDSGPGGVS
ncbi:MAG TPA: DUF6191 domain-containing protein [Actinophytocola sp.]|uniref:DUF6191 domain-containing protein n=1 Tax=Actinophytocola sp. TaxID=1872138 RepID=UPI002DDD7E6E|nr:DUF6191 domain-containing protein [Actinophytocola sp.]HEV2780331.1 DUF6191 domain-containing protein [Actinophytocola sp.]